MQMDTRIHNSIYHTTMLYEKEYHIIFEPIPGIYLLDSVCFQEHSCGAWIGLRYCVYLAIQLFSYVTIKSS